MDSPFLLAAIHIPGRGFVAQLGHLVLYGLVARSVYNCVARVGRYRFSINHNVGHINKPIDNTPFDDSSIAGIVFGARLAHGRLGNRDRFTQGPVGYLAAFIRFKLAIKPLKSVIE